MSMITAIVDGPGRPLGADESAPPEGRLHALWAGLPPRVAALVADRAAAETSGKAAHASLVRKAAADLQAARGAADRRRDAETQEMETLVATIREEASSAFAAEGRAIKAERDTLKRTAEARYRKRTEQANATYESAKWEASALFETAEKGASDRRAEEKAALAEQAQELSALREEAGRVLASYRRFLTPATEELFPQDEPAAAASLAAVREAVEAADSRLTQLQRLILPRLFRGPGLALLGVVPFLLAAYPLATWLGVTNGVIAAAVLATAVGVALGFWVVASSRRQVEASRGPLLLAMARADRLLSRAEAESTSSYRSAVEQATGKRDRDLARTRSARATLTADATKDRQAKVQEAEETASRRLAEIGEVAARAAKQADETEAQRRREIAEQHRADVARADLRHEEATRQSERAFREQWDALTAAWKSGMDGVASDAARLRESFSIALDDAFLASWRPPIALPEAIPVGQVEIALSHFPDGISRDPGLRDLAPSAIRVPALVDFPARASLVVDFSGDEGRERAIGIMQSVMLRMLTTLPPGKVRFTILDPVGLGRNFAGFMHLADYSEALVNTRIWTEPQDIDERLSELNQHIETVIQSYLRNEFATIEAYNAQAAEVAEPYRVLVVADFPSGFSESTARRLAAIAKSGPRCGVLAVIGLDTSQALPPSITRSDLVTQASRVSWKNGRFLFRDPNYEPFAFEAESPPPSEGLSRILRRVGEAAQAASRVEVPFDVIAPRPEDYWKGDSGKDIAIPLGRAGATKLQSLRLGRGTSQHVLIAGRTGSGKSTLLHALITNAALIYGPDEVELYLIDFKKGVEFKTYATHGLPHARVVAIESEREFGLSVLERLDSELKIRGDLYRDLGVQDVAGFREAAPGRPMPRMLLIVDEFQEFFVEDDKVAQQASLLLDRLVRQGRAFGIHVHLGSQTLGGAYALAKSTLGQMAVRIALQCSESDANLILNDDNSAARLLSRPGEAIYNDANGQVEGNHVFQVVWLPDKVREGYLKAIAQLARDRGVESRPAIVFEGNRPADVTVLPAFADGRKPRSGAIAAWLGEAIAIKDPTAATFRPQGGSNLLIVGQNEELASGIVAAMILAVAAQAPDDARVAVLDGSPDEAASADLLGRLVSLRPAGMQRGGLREAKAMLAEVAAEVDRRQGQTSESPPWFLVLYDLARFRDLRKQDDDFGYSRRGEEKQVPPSKLLGNILRDGPAVGVHTVAWCDSLNNVNRSFDRQALREFEMRVLFQMSAADSSNLMDSPAANRLGANRALFTSEGDGVIEKFRPFGLPSPEWIEALRSRWGSDAAPHAEG